MQQSIILHWLKFLLAIAVVATALSGCSGDDGEPGVPGAPGPGINPSFSAKSLDMTIDSVSINSPAAVRFSVRDDNGLPFVGLTSRDLRFNIAKLVPGAFGDPSTWQSYINRASEGAMQASQERNRTGYPLGDLVDHGDGSYTYTFATDLANADCPPPCEDADGNPLDVSYDPNLTHRVVIQLSHSVIVGLPPLNAIYTFRPADGATSGIASREIVSTESCNECHNQLRVHGSRVDTRFCVTCHNPGSWDPNGNTADFKVMIHKIHRGEDLPSGIPYVIGGHDYSTVAFPQDIRNCTKCHDGADSATPEGDNWKTKLSMQACGSCHDDKSFAIDGSEWGLNDPAGHSGGIMTDNSNCISCHKTSVFGSVEEAHTIPGKAEAGNFQFNIHDVSGGVIPSIQISVTNPANSDVPYDLSANAFTGGGARLAVVIGWGMTDFNNTGGTTNTGFPNFQASAALPISIDPVAACDAGIADWTCTPDTPVAGTYTLTKSTPLPVTATGTGRVGFEGHVAADFDGDLSFDDEVAIRSVVKDFVITGTLLSRREVIDINKCNNCHDQLSLHGGNRNDEPALCVICHNPNATDTGRRPPTTTDTTDGKLEEAIDFKVLIHSIHAGAETNYDATESHGFREKGLVVWGFPGWPCDQFGAAVGSCEHDFSHVRFPGILQDCTTCHNPDTYKLEGDWVLPTENGVLSTTVTTPPDITTPDDDQNISPTAAVCAACHDSSVARAHMVVPGGAVFDQTQSVIDGAVIETCSVCHGPGRSFDVDVVHGLD
ncbi:MAG: OmcA/MtrC family decaheme c-type cytochrome [Gammaproteobacteria bacterium]|nr:OmcA/MtrC family decaheme c-type cytochrome [Gammaproteobacteria bacterium]